MQNKKGKGNKRGKLRKGKGNKRGKIKKGKGYKRGKIKKDNHPELLHAHTNNSPENKVQELLLEMTIP